MELYLKLKNNLTKIKKLKSMKKLVFTLSLASLVMVSCGKSKDYDKILEEEKANAPKQETLEQPQTVDAAANGLSMMQKSDCFACHKADSKLLGPSWQEIANKYSAADLDVLTTHIIDGSTGIWGELQMTPHPGLSTDDAKAMVNYILTLKTN